MGSIEHLRRKIIVTTSVAALFGALIFQNEISAGFNSIGASNNTQPDANEMKFKNTLHEEVVSTMQGGSFNTDRFEMYEKTAFIYEGSIKDAALTTLANAGIVSPTPQETADANCAMDIATFGAEQIPANIREAYNSGNYDAAAGFCLYQIIDYDAADRFGQPGNPKGITYPAGLLA